MHSTLNRIISKHGIVIILHTWTMQSQCSSLLALAACETFNHNHRLYTARKMTRLIIFILLTPITGYHSLIVRDLRDTYGEHICPESAPTIGSDIKNRYKQQCLSPNDIIPATMKDLKTILVYGDRRAKMREYVTMETFIYDSFQERWINASNFMNVDHRLILKHTPYTQGMYYEVSFWKSMIIPTSLLYILLTCKYTICYKKRLIIFRLSML